MDMLILALIAAAAAAPGEGKTMAHDSWHAMTILGVGGESSTGAPYYLRVAAGDLDGDGAADEAYLKLTCADGVLKQVQYQVKSPRDSASGQASGKRMHKPMTIVKEWGAATPQLMAIKPTYDVKKVEGSGARSATDEWSPMTLANAGGLCPAAEAAAKRATKTRSNIQNN
jgi:hypothetical protein